MAATIVCKHQLHDCNTTRTRRCRDEGKVTDLASFRNLLRYANYTDPYVNSAASAHHCLPYTFIRLRVGCQSLFCPLFSQAIEDGKVSYGAALCMRQP